MAEKVTTMVLKVDLQCRSCHKKIKKLLSKFPQIRDQIYDEKQNTVTITVVCCSPEKIRDKLCCKGGKTIKSIEIKPPAKPKDTEKKPPKDSEKKDNDKPKDIDKPNSNGKPKDKEKTDKPITDKPHKEAPPPSQNPPDPSPPTLIRVSCYPPVYPPVWPCCGQCYRGYGDGPCNHGYGRPVPAPCNDNYGYAYYGNRGRYASSCDQYISEENPWACTIM